MPFKKYNENFLGIVVQNNDPEFRGRIKVFVPHISATVYKKWNEVKKDKRFKFVGKNISSDLSDILDDLKMIFSPKNQIHHNSLFTYRLEIF